MLHFFGLDYNFTCSLCTKHIQVTFWGRTRGILTRVSSYKLDSKQPGCHLSYETRITLKVYFYDIMTEVKMSFLNLFGEYFNIASKLCVTDSIIDDHILV